MVTSLSSHVTMLAVVARRVVVRVDVDEMHVVCMQDCLKLFLVPCNIWYTFDTVSSVIKTCNHVTV